MEHMCSPSNHEVWVKSEDVAHFVSEGFQFVVGPNLKSDKPTGQGGSVQKIKNDE